MLFFYNKLKSCFNRFWKTRLPRLRAKIDRKCVRKLGKYFLWFSKKLAALDLTVFRLDVRQEGRRMYKKVDEILNSLLWFAWWDVNWWSRLAQVIREKINEHLKFTLNKYISIRIYRYDLLQRAATVALIRVSYYCSTALQKSICS